MEDLVCDARRRQSTHSTRIDSARSSLFLVGDQSTASRTRVCYVCPRMFVTWTELSGEYRQMQITRMTISVRRPDDLLAGGPICGCFVQLPAISHYHRLRQRLLRRARVQLPPGTVSIARPNVIVSRSFHMRRDIKPRCDRRNEYEGTEG